jgi:hypothetical protein
VEPSEIILAAPDPANPVAAPIPGITLRPLVADPQGAGRPVLVDVSVCANDPAAMAPPGNGADPTGFPAGGARTTVGSALCDGDPTEVPIASDVDLVAAPAVDVRLDPAWIANAFMRDVFLGPDRRVHGGFDLGMPVVLQITARAGGESVRAVKRVIFWAGRVRDDQVANVSPAIAGVRVYDRRDETTAEPLPDAVQDLVIGSPVAVPPGGVWVDPAPAQAEPYVTAVLDRLTGAVTAHDVPRETLHYTFYATAGTFSPIETSSEPPPGVTAPVRVHIESKYHPPPAGQAPPDVTIWIVVRDERGGTSWVSRNLQIPATAASESQAP